MKNFHVSLCDRAGDPIDHLLFPLQEHAASFNGSHDAATTFALDLANVLIESLTDEGYGLGPLEKGKAIHYMQAAMGELQNPTALELIVFRLNDEPELDVLDQGQSDFGTKPTSAKAKERAAELDPSWLERAQTLFENNANQLVLLNAASTQKEIDHFRAVAQSRNLSLLRWTYSAGFIVECVGDQSSQQDAYLLAEAGEKYALAPADALNFIIKHARSAVYLLDDFHFYWDHHGKFDFHLIQSLIKELDLKLSETHDFHLFFMSATADVPQDLKGVVQHASSTLDQSGATSALSQYSRELGQPAGPDAPQVFVARTHLVRQIVKILSKMEINNPILIGPPGVGKTALVQGLAQSLQAGEFHGPMAHKKIVELFLFQLLGGTEYRGSFETRIGQIVEQLRAQAGQVILFIDEIHTLFNLGRTEGSSGIQEILKPFLARGEIPLIGATTAREYEQTIAKDPAFARRFHTVRIDEPNHDEVFQICRAFSQHVAQFHGVSIGDAALEYLIEQVSVEMPDEYFPGKAVKVLDGAAATCQILGHTELSLEIISQEILEYRGNQ
jgi:hypothetical protein